MVLRNTSRGGTTFTVSVGAQGRGVKTRISAGTGPEDLARPGRIFPLRARGDGVLARRGHPEAAVDLARFAGLKLSGVILRNR